MRAVSVCRPAAAVSCCALALTPRAGRVGGRSNYEHCARCDACFAKGTERTHICIESALRRQCPICMEDMFTSITPIVFGPCGHSIHEECRREMLLAEHYRCPTCNRSFVDMTQSWRQLDEEVRETPMPEEYRNWIVPILCNDCQRRSTTAFHIVGLKCASCGSYNTSQIRDP